MTSLIPSQLNADTINQIRAARAQPLLATTPFAPAIFCLTDYASSDLALKEVTVELEAACAHLSVRPSALHAWPLPGLDTVATAFEGAQLAFNSTFGFGAIYYVNCDPRLALSKTARKNNAGGRFVAALLPNGATYFGVDSGHGLAFLVQSGVTIYHLNLDATGSQFRSRDFFPWVVATYARYLQDCVAEGRTDAAQVFAGFPLLGAVYDASQVPPLAQGCVLYTDNFGNLKLNLWHETLLQQYPVGTSLTITCGDKTLTGQVAGGSFEVDNNTLAISRSSSGWVVDGNKRWLTELFIPGQRAADLLGNPKNGTVIELRAAQQSAA